MSHQPSPYRHAGSKAGGRRHRAWEEEVPHRDGYSRTRHWEEERPRRDGHSRATPSRRESFSRDGGYARSETRRTSFSSQSGYGYPTGGEHRGREQRDRRPSTARSSSARPSTSHSRPDYRAERERQRHDWMYQDRIQKQKKEAERQRKWEEHLAREKARKRAAEEDARHRRRERERANRARDEPRRAEPEREDQAERRAIAKVKFAAWKAEMDKLFADRAAARSFPQPPFLGCREAACHDRVKDRTYPLNTCRHSFKRLLQDSGNLTADGYLKTLRRNIHPDRFSARKDLQSAAEETFKLVEGLLQDPECR